MSYIRKLCYPLMINLAKYTQNNSVTTDEGLRLKLALVTMVEVEEIKKLRWKCDLNLATAIAQRWLQVQGCLIL